VATPHRAALGDSGYNWRLRFGMVQRGLMLAFVISMVFLVLTPWASSEQDQSRVPAFNAGPPAKGVHLPPILGKEQLWGDNAAYPFQRHAYELAAKIPNVIYQQPCYCYCDRMGHKSLHTCFEKTHGAQCSTCMKELYYSYQMTVQHKTPAQIRTGIMAGEWKQIDLESAATMN
jgi:hypothetical protein